MALGVEGDGLDQLVADYDRHFWEFLINQKVCISDSNSDLFRPSLLSLSLCFVLGIVLSHSHLRIHQYSKLSVQTLMIFTYKLVTNYLK